MKGDEYDRDLGERMFYGFSTSNSSKGDRSLILLFLYFLFKEKA